MEKSISNSSETRLFALFAISICFLFFSDISAADQLLPENLKNTGKLFNTFIGKMTEDDLENGNCVNHSIQFSKFLAESGEKHASLRIILMVKEPGRGFMPNPIKPDNEYIRGKAVNFWIWHSFTLIDSYAFDPKYKHGTNDLKTYFSHLWSKSPDFESFWIFSVTPDKIPEISGSPYPGAAPRMFSFVPISPSKLIEDPSHISKRK
ncbi:MAG: hypothetical protein HQM10_19605 [Candidatus Riflebacteria bacterium]|nr:hypothetical protein [Candidatus Riflebacteria bacterium]